LFFLEQSDWEPYTIGMTITSHPYAAYPTRATAFSLVELSIVLVILGLLAGGVLSGQALIRAAELRSVTTDISTIQSSSYTFRDKYFHLPGDMPNATRFWGAAGTSTTGNDEACYTASSTDKPTCNGNGNGRIDSGHSTSTAAERGHYWKQLANAGLIEGQYTGYHGPYASEMRKGGVNAKGSKVSGTHWNIAYVSVGVPTGDERFYDSVDTNMVELTLDFNVTEVQRSLFRPEDQWNIDTKIDDGKPGMGVIRGPKQAYTYAPNCTNSTTTAAEYNLSLTSRECFPMLYLR
jgi:prepilin-type N-terminal cleavage/methylation domain-containing protein